MTVTTGGRGSGPSRLGATCAPCRSSSIWFSFSSLGVWPISSTTSTAVSWSIGWLMVAMTPMFMSTLMTSFALTAIFCASSATVTVSPMPTSRFTGAVGISKACRPSAPAEGCGRALTRRFFL